MLGTVLVLTHQFDPTADLVIEELNRRGVPLFRCDVGQFPTEVTASAELAPASWSGVLTLDDRAIRLDEIQWGWIEDEVGAPIAAAIAGALEAAA